MNKDEQSSHAMAQDEDVPYSLIDKLQESGINAADLKKLKDALLGFLGVFFLPKKRKWLRMSD